MSSNDASTPQASRQHEGRLTDACGDSRGDGQSRTILFTSTLDYSQPHRQPLFNDYFEGNAMSSGATHSRSKPPSVINEAVLLHHDGEEADHKESIPWRTWAICFLCALAQFQNTFLGISPAANAFAIAGAVGGSDKRIWIVQAQGIPSIITGPIMAIISDLYGRRWIIVGAFLVAAVASIVGMTSTSMTQIIIAQTLAGCAGGISGTMFAVPSEVMPSRYRAHVQTGMSWFSGLSSIPALIGMGAAINADPINGWRWVFRTQLITNGIICVGFFLLYHPPARTQTIISFSKRIATLDWIGYFLLFAGLVPLLMGFAWASDTKYGWKDPHAYGAVVAGFVGFSACLLYEWKGRDDGFIHHELFRHGWNFPIAVFVIAVEGSLFYLLNNIWPTQVFTLYSHDSIIASLYLLPFFMTIVVVSPFLSLYATKYKDVKWPIVAGFVFFLSAIIGYGTTTATSNKAAIAYNVLAGIGFSSPLILIISLVQLSTPPLYIGITSALVISARTLGGTVGLAIAEVIYAAKTNTQVPAAIAAAAIPLGFSPANLTPLIIAILSGAGFDKVPGVTGQIIGAASAAAHAVQAKGFRTVWLSFIPAVVIAGAVTCLFRNPKERMTWSVDAPLEVHDHDHEKVVEGVEHGDFDTKEPIHMVEDTDKR